MKTIRYRSKIPTQSETVSRNAPAAYTPERPGALAQDLLGDKSGSHPGSATRNNLFPVFIKLDQLQLLIIGGGSVGHEKLATVLNNAPQTAIRLVALHISEAVRSLARAYPNVELYERAYQASDLEQADLIIAAVNDPSVSSRVAVEARAAEKLINVADQPLLCDFYLGAIVQKGALKIAISTNGKSPTLARRIKELLADTLPEEVDELLENIHHYRCRLGGSLPEKVKKLNALTQSLTTADPAAENAGRQKWRKVAYACLASFLLLIAGNLFAEYIAVQDVWESLVGLSQHLDHSFYLMMLTGFLAQLVDGALGMGYGVTCATVLLYQGVPLPAISSSIHTAEIFSSGASGFSHYKFGNVNKKLLKLLLLPGIVGAIAGALLIAGFGETYAHYFRPLLAAYTLFLGARIFLHAFRKKRKKQKVKRVGLLALSGGFLDAFGGAGWGPLVTSTLISKGKTPRYIIGTVSLVEFFVTIVSAVTFFSFIGITHWPIIAGLIIGGVIGAPVAAKLAGKLPVRVLLVAVGSVITLTSLYALYTTLN